MALSLIDFQGRTKLPENWIIPNFLTRANTAFVMGQPKKACKSWLLLALAWDLTEGKPVWSIPGMKPERPMTVVYFTQEDTEDDIHDRVHAHLKGGRQPNERLWIAPKNLNHKLDTHQGRDLIQKELDGIKEKAGSIDLVMFDPMRRIHNGNENDSDTIAEIWTVIDRIHKRYGCATIISHHTVKPPANREGYDPTDPYVGRGSGDIYGGGDAFAVVVPGPMALDKTWRQVNVFFESKRAKEMPAAKFKVWFETGRVEHMGEASHPQRGRNEEAAP